LDQQGQLYISELGCESNIMRAGFSNITITPPMDLTMGGYRLRRGIAQGIHDDLQATCCVMEGSTISVVLISLDLLCLPQDAIQKIKSAMSEACDIEPKSVIISCTHTHSGPDTIGISGVGKKEITIYFDWLAEQIVELSLNALYSVTELNISYVHANVEGIAFNRRLRLRDGKVVSNLDAVTEEMIESRGIVDPAGMMIVFENQQGVAGVLVNFTMHATVLDERNYLYSRDFPGYLVDRLSRELPGEPVVMFVNGAFGNVNQIRAPGKWISSFDEARKIGGQIAEVFIDKFDDRERLNVTDIDIQCTRVNVPRRRMQIQTNDDIVSLVLKARKSAPRGRLPEDIDHKQKLFLDEVQQLKDSDYDVAEIQIVVLDELEIIAVPGELFVEYGLEMKKKSRYAYPIVFGNSNGYIGYIPTHSAFNEGGYETTLSLTSRLIPEAGEILLENIELLREKL